MTTPPIIGFIGRRGTGKTLLMSTFLFKMVQAEKCIQIYANYRLMFPGHRYNPMTKKIFDEMFGKEKKAFDIYNAVFVFDEISMWADAYDFHKPAIRKLVKFALQSRKRGISILYSAQYLDLVPRRLRKVTERIVYPEYDGESDTLTYTVVSWPDETVIAKNLIKGVSKYHNYYDSDEVIMFDEEGD